MKPLCIDLFCGLGGWTEGFLAEGYDVVGFDIEQHVYGDHRYHAQLVLQDVKTLHGSQFKDAAVIVASPPCQEYSYMAMPWSRAKKIAAEYRSGVRDVRKLTELFDACFRIAAEAGVPMIVENVKGAQPWVGPAKWHYGSFYLWGDVPALMPDTRSRKWPGNSTWFGVQNNGEKHIQSGPHGQKAPGFNFHQHEKTGEPGGSFQSAAVAGIKNPGMDWSKHGQPGYKAQGFNVINAQRFREGEKTTGHVNKRDGYTHTRHLTNQRESDAVKVGGDYFSGELRETNPRRHASKSDSRKAASAQIAKIPLPLSKWIAKCFKPPT